MRKTLLIALLGMMHLILPANVTAYFNYGVFNIPGKSPFLETYLTIIGNSIRHKKVPNGYQGSVNIKVNIFSGEKLIKADNYNLLSPIDKDTLNTSGFIDNQRYSLSNGSYTLEITLIDNNDPGKKAFTYKESLFINYSPAQLACSSIEPLESYAKTVKPTSISKSGFDLIPYSVNYYPEKENKLLFYFESYYSDTVLGRDKNFVYSYFVERKEDLFKPTGLSGFKKQRTASVNPLLVQLDISNLESGNYYLVIQLRDEKNILQLEKKWFFQRNKLIHSSDSIAVKQSVDEFFGNYNNVDTLKMFIECLWPISTETQREWEINQSVKKEPELMKKFIVDFWTKKAGDSLNPLQLWLNYYKQVLEVNRTFKCGKQKGYYTDRGRAYLQYGPPNQRVQQPSEPYAYPYEIWQYYRIEDKVTGQFYTNRKFVFVNKAIADDCYLLIHSDMRGEINNPKWQYEVSKRNQTNNNNIDKDKVDPAVGNNFDDFFNNPK